jgi:GDP-L-fucose synthase
MTGLDLSGRRVWLAGGGGLLGKALHRRLALAGSEILAPGRQDLDLRDPAATAAWAETAAPDFAIIAAAAAGGIQAHLDRPGDVLHENLLIAASTIEAARVAGVQKLLFIGSAAVYPPHAPQPFKEEMLMSGPLEPAHEGYALAKLAGIKLCQTYRRQHGCDFISALPTNFYGPDPRPAGRHAHVVPSLMRRFADAARTGAATVEVWGTGKARREFLYVDDAADACVTLLERYSGEDPVNVGVGHDVAITDLAREIAQVTKFGGDIAFDATKPDGASRRILDISRLSSLGWRPETSLRAGLEKTYASMGGTHLTRTA